MKGQIYINGLIGSTLLETGVELIDIVTQVKKQPNATSFDVHINSPGGVVDTGFNIFDYLKSLNLPITTIGNELVASIATVIFMAGDIRVLKPNVEFMIHLPSGYIEGTADEINQYGDMVKSVEKKVVNFYKDILNISEEAIIPLLQNETYLTLEQAFDLGFTNSQLTVEPIMARAIFNNNNEKEEQMTKKDLEDVFAPVIDFIKGAKKQGDVVSLKVTDANAVIIDFPALDDLSMPTAGDEAMVDGQPASGSYVMPNGDTWNFEAGKLIDIVISMAQDELQNALNENADLRKQLEEAQSKLTASATNLEVKEKEVEAKEAKIVEIESSVVALKKQITSKLDFDKQTIAPVAPVVAVVDSENRLSGVLEKIKQLKK